MMKIAVLSKKEFKFTYPMLSQAPCEHPEYGSLVVTFTGRVLHFLWPKDCGTSLNFSVTPSTTPVDLKQFDEIVTVGTPFQASVWRALMSIESGHVNTYGGIAKQIGSPRAARAVGQAVGGNPISVLIPCHRVIASDGTLGGFAWGPELKLRWLRAEGTHFNF